MLMSQLQVETAICAHNASMTHAMVALEPFLYANVFVATLALCITYALTVAASLDMHA